MMEDHMGIRTSLANRSQTSEAPGRPSCVHDEGWYCPLPRGSHKCVISRRARTQPLRVGRGHVIHNWGDCSIAGAGDRAAPLVIEEGGIKVNGRDPRLRIGCKLGRHLAASCVHEGWNRPLPSRISRVSFEGSVCEELRVAAPTDPSADLRTIRPNGEPDLERVRGRSAWKRSSRLQRGWRTARG